VTTPERARFDVMFYTPWIGSILSRVESMPPGGAETQILMLARALAAQGARVAIIVFGHPSDLPRMIDGVTIVTRPPYHRPTGARARIAEAVRIWRALWRVPALVVVQRGSGTELAVIAVFAKLTGRSFVYSSAHIADFDRRLISRPAFVRLQDLGMRLADLIVVQTPEQAQRCEAKLARRPVLINSLAVLENPPVGPPEAFLWVGRLNSYKRPLEYLELARALPEARFWMVAVPLPHHEGDRLLIDEVISRAAEVPNLELLPPRSHEEVGSLMSRAVAAVNTAEFEGMPNVLLEAWSRGVPALVLHYDPGGVVRAHRLGAFAEGSLERLAEFAREQWLDREGRGREELSRRCRAYIGSHHSPELVARQWLEALASTELGRRGGGGWRRPFAAAQGNNFPNP
jgi:glycosyltransferase involved in cell wall biosynthesis